MTTYSWDSWTWKYISSGWEVLGWGKASKDSSWNRTIGWKWWTSSSRSSWWSVSWGWGSWWGWWWSSSWGSWTYRWAWGSWLTNTDWASKYGSSEAYKSAVAKYWANNVHDALDYISTWGWSKSQINYLLSWWGSINAGWHINYNANGSQLSWPKDSHWFAMWISGMQFWQWTPDDYQDARNTTLWNYYSTLGKYDYNTIYNDLSKNKWFASADENNKRATVNKIMEKAANASWWTLTGKSDEEIAAEQWNNNEDDDARLNDVLWEFWEEVEEEPYSYDYDELFWDWADAYGKKIDELESQLNSNTVKTSVPEERDTSYDYNTYYKENLAPDNNYENWESKNTLNEEPQTTLVSQYQEPVSTALNDLGLLTPNEAVTNETPNAEEPDLPKGYENWEDIVTDFENQLQTLWSEEGTGLTPQAVAQTYSDFKNQLVQYANNNNLSKEEYEALLAQLKNNEILQNVLINKQ